MHPLDFVVIPSGTGWIGSTSEEIEACVETWAHRLAEPEFTTEQFSKWILKEFPKHPVRFDSFRLTRFPITNDQYRAFLDDVGGPVPESIVRSEADNCPVWGVSYTDCERFGSWIGATLRKICRLPTEAEWEYAARGPDNLEYPYGNQFDAAKGNSLESGKGRVTSVHDYEAYPSGFGICDMAGNVEEWTSSRYQAYPNGITVEDELTRTCGIDYRVLRGGSFCRNGDLTRCARRHGPHPGSTYRYRGFRLLMVEG